VLIEHNICLLLLLNITLILALSAVSYKLLKRSSLYAKISGCNSTISQASSTISAIFANRYLIIRRLIKIDSDDGPMHQLLILQL